MSTAVAVRGDRNVVTRTALLTNETLIDLANNDLQRRRRFGEAGVSVAWCHHNSPEPVTKRRNNCIRLGDHERTETLKFTLIANVLYLVG